MPKYERYQDYVIRDGRLIGEFEQMYRDFVGWFTPTLQQQLRGGFDSLLAGSVRAEQELKRA